ncbi:MAG: hypothetical protein MUC60_16810 [Oscillatoria sp. Prado101]|nr:hypothetical protein [Oscillatoria sp. Prado101]
MGSVKNPVLCLEKVCSWALALPARLRWSQFSLVAVCAVVAQRLRRSIVTASEGDTGTHRQRQIIA